MNRAKLLAMLRKECAYEGDGSLDSVRKFITDNAIELRDEAGKTLNLDEIYKAKTVFVMADAGEEVVLSALGSAGMDEGDEDDGKEYDSDDDEGEKTLTIAERRKALTRVGKATGDRRAVAAMAASVANGRSARSAAHKAYQKRIDRMKIVGYQAEKSPIFPDPETAEAFGAQFRTALLVANKMPAQADDLAIMKSYFGSKATMIEGSNLLGGALVAPEFSPFVVELFEEYGITRRLLNVMSMSTDQTTFSKELDYPDAYWQGEAASITETNAEYANITLTTKKLIAIIRMSTELVEDAAVRIADRAARGLARRFARKEDEAAWLGDGTSTHGGIVGFNESLKDVDGAGTDSAGLVVGTTTTDTDWTTFDADDFREAVGLLPVYAEDGASWVCSKKFYWHVWQKAAFAAGGMLWSEFQNTSTGNPMILGYPVNFHQSMPTASAPGTNVVVATLGNYSLAAAMGDRAAIQMAMSPDRYFDTDEIAMRARERVDIKVHSVGSSSAAGPVVGLVTSAS